MTKQYKICRAVKNRLFRVRDSLTTNVFVDAGLPERFKRDIMFAVADIDACTEMLEKIVPPDAVLNRATKKHKSKK